MSRGTTLTLLAISAVGGAAAFAACSKATPEPAPESKPTPTTVISATPPAINTVATVGSPVGAVVAAAAGPDNLAYDPPASWTSVPNTNSMRKATFKIPKVTGDTEDAELAVSAAGGGVEPNIKRWAGQFGGAEAKTEPRTVNGLKVTLVEMKGTYASGSMMGGPAVTKEKQMLLGAIVEGGEQLHFFKMIGPEKTVTAAKKDFEKFVGTFRAK